MESNETEDVKINNPELHMYSKLEVLLKARNKIIFNKEVILPCALTDDIDLSDTLDDDDIPKVRPHKHLQDNANLVNAFMDNIRKQKHTSEREMDFVIDEGKNLDDKINQTILSFRQQTEKLFKKIINTQVGFNECLSSNISGDNLGNKSYLKNHSKLIEQTCKLDRGLESIIRCNNDTLEKTIEKNFKIDDEDELKKVSDEMAQGILSTVYEAGTKKFKNHEHLLAVKQYNKSTTGGISVQNIAEGTIDPYTKRKITKPVRNKVCTHIYDQESVDLMFQDKFFVPCPYIGCTNKHFTKKDLLYESNISNDSD